MLPVYVNPWRYNGTSLIQQRKRNAQTDTSVVARPLVLGQHSTRSVLSPRAAFRRPLEFKRQMVELVRAGRTPRVDPAYAGLRKDARFLRLLAKHSR